MADEAFALSPISARATQPGEEDYDAISQAFMETSRGRWFLSEYTRRNRNADTRMVLDAVSKIEASLAAQRQPVAGEEIAEALAEIRNAVAEAKTTANAAIDGLALEQHLVPIRKGIRVIGEIAWRLREIGADGRIWDLVDSQLAAIESGCGQIATADPKAALGAAFELIETQIDRAAGHKQEQSTTENASDSLSDSVNETAPSQEMQTAAMAEAEEAYDDAMLDMVALEMAAPDPDDDDDALETEVDQAVETVPFVAPPENVVQQTEAARSEPAMLAATAAATESVHAPPLPVPAESKEPAADRSLGAALISNGLIANGLIAKSRAALSDPLAPIRRMSQAEKIAFFS